MKIDKLMYWITERHSIYERRKKGLPKPWTEDKILQTYKFTNVYRELDTVTIWIRENWRKPHSDDKDVWFAMVVARLVNWPETLGEVGYPVPWLEKRFSNILATRKGKGRKVFTGAYMVRADANLAGSKASYLAERVFTPMWENRSELRPKDNDTLASFYQRLSQCRDMGSFMAGQVVVDTKFTVRLNRAKDWWSWAVSGPGSRRGLNRVFGRDKNERWIEHEWKNMLDQLGNEVVPAVKKLGMPRLSASDLQNCLCEWDKFERVRLGEGRPRSLYPGLPESGNLF